MARLSDTANVILSTAAARDNRRVLPLPNVKAPPVAVRKILTKMLADGLAEEVRAARDDETWEHAEGSARTTLIVTAAGLAAIVIEDREEVAVKSGQKDDKRPARTKKPGRGAKVATKAGGSRTAGSSDKSSSRARTVDTGGNASKQDAVIALLRRAHGASIEDMIVATDWQAHSIRGFMSGALKKRLGLKLVSEKDRKSGERRYYVAPLKSK